MVRVRVLNGACCVRVLTVRVRVAMVRVRVLNGPCCVWVLNGPCCVRVLMVWVLNRPNSSPYGPSSSSLMVRVRVQVRVIMRWVRLLEVWTRVGLEYTVRLSSTNHWIKQKCTSLTVTTSVPLSPFPSVTGFLHILRSRASDCSDSCRLSPTQPSQLSVSNFY